MNKNSFLKNFFKKSKNRIRVILPLEKIKIIAVVLVLLCVYAVVQISSFDMNLDCERTSHTCTISRKNFIDPTIINVSRFDSARIYSVAVATRRLPNNKIIYDLLVDYGTKNGGEAVFIDYGFYNQIKANTVRVKFEKYMQTGAPPLNISKHCYFDEYFCF